MARWPAQLPAPQVAGYQVSPADQTVRTELEAGTARVRRISAARSAQVQVAWVLTDEQLFILRQWFYAQPWSVAGPSDSLADWLLSRVTLEPDVVIGPDGITLADKLVENTAESAKHLATFQILDQPDNAVLLYGAAVKAAGRDWVLMQITAKDNSNNNTYVDLINGSFGQSLGLVSKSIEALGDGWYRVVIAANLASGDTTPSIRAHLATGDASQIYTGDGTSGIYLTDVNARLLTGTDPFLPTDANGAVDGADGGAGWFTLDLAYGALGLTPVEARFVGPWTAVAVPAKDAPCFKWQVSAQLELRDA